MNEPTSESATSEQVESRRPGGLLSSEDWWAVWIGGIVLGVTLLLTLQNISTVEVDGQTTVEVVNPVKSWFSKPGSWTANPLDAFRKADDSGEWQWKLKGLVGPFILVLLLFAAALPVMGRSSSAFVRGYPVVFLLALLAYVLAAQVTVKHYNLEYALWALMVGLIVSNTVGTPDWLRPAVMTEFYIKTGLVILGAGVLLSELWALGKPGVFVAWVVTPVVLISTYAFGQKVLKLKSKSLNMVISADMSVCGVSAAIATAAACKAKKEELSVAVGMSLSFTVIMMVVMPLVIQAVHMNDVLAGAWMGGTIDATGAVAAAGAMLGPTAEKVATTIKMIQNILIGVTAFGVAVYWVTSVERDANTNRPDAMEIWRRFPKFVLGFVAASIVFSLVHSMVEHGPAIASAVTSKSSGITTTIRGWLFCLAFVSIGLETNFKELFSHLGGGKPLVLYVCGQSLNLVLTLLMAWLMFEKVFPDAKAIISQ